MTKPVQHIRQTAYALILTLMSSAAFANQTVVELFTSQGCSSCPPADRLAEQLALRDDLLVLSLPVTYWDYLGWKDTFASKANTKRQHKYANLLGRSQVFTPQMIIDGTHSTVGSRGADVLSAINKAQQDDHRAPQIRADGKTITIAATTLSSGRQFDVKLISYNPSATVKIGRGENHGRTITYTNIVRSINRIGIYTGQSVTLPRQDAPPDTKQAIILQDHTNGTILAAQRL